MLGSVVITAKVVDGGDVDDGGAAVVLFVVAVGSTVVFVTSIVLVVDGFICVGAPEVGSIVGATVVAVVSGAREVDVGCDVDVVGCDVAFVGAEVVIAAVDPGASVEG